MNSTERIGSYLDDDKAIAQQSGTLQVTVLNEPGDLARCLTEVADACGVEIADLPDLAAQEGSIVWERLKASKVSLAELTPISLASAETYQRSNGSVSHRHRENFQENGATLDTDDDGIPTMDNEREIPVLQINYPTAKELFSKKLSFKNMDDRQAWGKEKLEHYLNERFVEMVDESSFKPRDPFLSLYKDIVATTAAGGRVEVVGFGEDVFNVEKAEEEEMAGRQAVVVKKRGRPKGSKNKPKEVPPDFEKVLPSSVSPEVLPEKVKLPKAPKQVQEKKFIRTKPLSLSKKVGIVTTIVEALRKGTEKKPISKRQIHAILVKKYGPGTSADKDVLGMWSTLGAQLSTKLKDRGFVLGKTCDGYWIVSEA